MKKYRNSITNWTFIFILIAEVTTQLWPNEDQISAISLTPGKKYVTRNDQTGPPLNMKRLDFDVKLLQEVGDLDGENNIVLSPISVKTLLGLLLHGAVGTTASELQRVLNLSKNQTEAKQQLQYIQRAITLMGKEFPVRSANAIYLANRLQPKKEFVDNARDTYFTKIGNLNADPTAAENEINNWVYKETGGLIPTIITPGLIKPETQLILLNAMHFKGRWAFAFPEQATRPQLFYPKPREPICVNMMSLRANLKHNYEQDINADVFQIPFQTFKFVLAIVLPREKDGIIELQKDLNQDDIVKYLTDQESLEVTLSLPRFTAEFATDLTDKLEKMKLREIFSTSSKLPNITEGAKDLKIDTIIHKASLQVDEEGAVAAASTVSSVVPLMSPGDKIDIVVDHPFLFFIYNTESKMILFEGRITQPQQANMAECQSAKNQRPIAEILDEIYSLDIRQGDASGNERFGSTENRPVNTKPTTDNYQQTSQQTSLQNNYVQQRRTTTTANPHKNSFSTTTTYNNENAIPIHQTPDPVTTKIAFIPTTTRNQGDNILSPGPHHSVTVQTSSHRNTGSTYYSHYLGPTITQNSHHSSTSSSFSANSQTIEYGGSPQTVDYNKNHASVQYAVSRGQTQH